MSVEVAYVGNKGTHVFAGLGGDYDFNQPTEVGFGTLSASERKPFFPRFGWEQNFRYYGSDADNSYNALQVKFEKRFSNSYSFLSHYSWGRCFDHTGEYYTINRRIGYGPCDYQREHVLLFSNIVELPFGKGHRFLSSPSRALDYLAGGWQINAFTTISSGLPFTPSYQDCGTDIDNGPCRVDIVGGVSIDRDATAASPTGVPYFTTTPQPDPAKGAIELATNAEQLGPYRRPLPGTFGTATRNSFHGPRFWDSDVSLFKNFRITEKVSGQFRAESFNTFNHVNLNNPNTCVDCGTSAGRIFGLTPGAFMPQCQWALRFEW